MRVIAATNRVLREMIAQGQFREDLFYRINVIHIVVPPLRERREDIPLLVDHFLANMGRNNGSRPVVSPEAYGAHRVPWPGNVRELENVIERILVSGLRPEHPRRRPAARDPDAAQPGSGRSASAAGRWPTISSSG